jgi:xylulokinase
MACFMGIDLGTSSLKAMVIDDAGKVLAQSSRSYQFDSPKVGYAEQSLETWWEACRDCIRETLVRLGRPASEVVALSFSGQMHGAVLLDGELREVRPAILHCDARSSKQVRDIKAVLGREGLLSALMNPIYTGFLLPSLAWVRENEGELFAKIRHAMLPKDYLKLRLCGEVVSDYSDASATLAFDIAKGRWSREILDVLGIPESIFPQCSSSDAPIGKVNAAAARETGLAAGTIVVNGGGDQVMQAIGNGAIRAGQATVNIGSSGQVCFQSDRPIADPERGTNTFCGYEPGKWLTMGATMTAGLSLKWFGRVLGDADYRDLDEGARKVGPGSGGLVFLPYLNGERTPHLDPELCGMMLGIHLGTGRYEMARAVMEGVAYSLLQCIEVCGGLGLEAGELIASGGGAASPVWLQIQADVYGLPLKTAVVGEQAVLGAAIAAGSGAGTFSGIADGCARVVRYRDEIYAPDRARHESYAEYYRLFKDAYSESAGLLRRATGLGRA